MDSLILEAIVQRLAALSGRTLARIERTGDLEYCLRFDPAPSEDLFAGIRPPHAHLHRGSPASPIRPLPADPFCQVLHQHLKGARLRTILRPSCDRVVEMHWEDPEGEGAVLVAELIGKAANLVLLDSERRVLAFARKLASAFRAPRSGQPYQPPFLRTGYDGVTWAPTRAAEYIERFSSAGSPVAAAAAFLRGLSPALGEDFLRRGEALADPTSTLAEILEAVRGGRCQPVLYTEAPVERMLAEPGLWRQAPVLSPFPLCHPPFAVATPLADVEEASRLFTALCRAQASEQGLRDRLAGAIRRGIGRIERLEGKLQKELSATEHAEEFQRYGDLILAHPEEARVTGDRIVLPDLYDPEQSEVEIPADPALSPGQNAERHYARARKLRRGAETIRARLEAVRAARDEASRWKEELEQARTLEDLRALEKNLVEERVVPPPVREGRRRSPEMAEADKGIRRFRTEDGFLILVGKTSRDNDRLTFLLAAPHDFWLHAAERSGAHVVVRNPSRLKELPAPALLSAARIAAHFSRSRGKGKVEVHYTLRKHVRKGKGRPPGSVTIRNHRSLEVEPGIPGATENDA